MRIAAHLAVGLAVGLSLLPLRLLVEDPALPLLVLILLGSAAAVGAILSALRLPRFAVLLAQAVALGGLLLWQALALSGMEATAAFGWLVSDGVEAIRTGAAPVAGTPGLTWLVLVLAAVLTLAAEVLANALEQPAWTAVPLSVTFGAAALLIRPDLPWPLALPVVAAYVLVLLAATPTGRDAAGRLSRRGAFQASRAASGIAMGAVAAGLAFVLALAVPVGDPRNWGDDGPDGPIQLGDPTVQLDRDLRRPTDVKVLTYTSSDGRPLYLRTVALPLLTTGGAKLVPMELHRSGLERAHDFPGEQIEVDVTMSSPS
ncbi:MAG TPA: transglutaminaseTgpA domain-containing protein, partial [Arachnia sp.]|nr:transglutaminaseTgpA domain-containing protein [Arachnia sp.]